jgi:pyruvate/2-oxoglutarate dehydrogenase complex dihydrolipoamide dehydrogenase (E3) component
VVVVGIGRDIDCSGLNPEAAGVELDEKGRLLLDKYHRTTNRNILAIGDVAAGPQFSHAAEYQATILISNLFSPFKKKIDYNKFSWVTFTYPELASFGLTEEQLKNKRESYEKLELNFNEDDRAITDSYQYGKLILYVSPSFIPFGKQKLLGGSMIAPLAGEMIQELTLTQSAGLGIRALFNKIHAYPTGSRVNKNIILNKYREVIRPWMIKILKLLY